MIFHFASDLTWKTKKSKIANYMQICVWGVCVNSKNGTEYVITDQAVVQTYHS